MSGMRLLALASAALVVVACSASHASEAKARPAASVDGAGTTTSSTTAATTTTATTTTPAVPRFAHIVVVVEENHSYADVIGSAQAPYINTLASSGTLLTNSYGVRHPSEPNYVALFSGSTHGLTDDSCPHSYSSSNLGFQLRARGMRFLAYSESLPSTGYLGCSYGGYARKHAPWTDFTDLPASVGRPTTAFPTDYRQLPRVSFVVPNLNHDMHDGTIAQADTWLRGHLGGYVTWARRNNSLLVVTWDEDDRSANNQVPGVLAGAHVRHIHYGGRVDHYTVLRTIEAAYGLPPLGAAAHRNPITAVWSP
jgi:phosphatidylinositol-3-phosphatase